MQYFFKYVLTYFLHLNSYLVTFLHNTICRAQLFYPSASFGISFKHAVQLPFTVLLYSTFPDNYAFLSLSPSQIKNTQSADTVPVHGHSPLVMKIGKHCCNGNRFTSTFLLHYDPYHLPYSYEILQSVNLSKDSLPNVGQEMLWQLFLFGNFSGFQNLKAYACS